MRKINYWEKFRENVHYHIYNRGINGVNIFKKENNYHYFLKKWQLLVHPFFDTEAYCLMPNHFHFLVKVKPLNDEIRAKVKGQLTSKSREFLNEEISHNQFLEDQFKRLFSSYALAFNKQEGRTGSLFQKRFKRVSLKTDNRLWYILTYIHHNPIHHKFVKNYYEWEFSSYSAFLSNQSTLLARNQVFDWFDSDRNKAKLAFVNLHKSFQLDSKEDYVD